MRRLLLAMVLLSSISVSHAQAIIEDSVKIDHAWVQGVYWNAIALPGWGFFVDAQEETMFGAVYGYLGDEPSFIVFLGSAVTIDPLVYQGDVFFVTEPGVSEQIVGTFTWSVQYSEAAPAALLTLSSNLLNVTNLALTRFSYVEVDKVDMLTGGDWNIVRRVLGITFGDHYEITDLRVDDEYGSFAAGVVDNSDTEKIGALVYVPPEEGGVYGILIPFSGATNAFYLFFANNTDMWGRYWLLDPDETPTGDGSHFRGAADNMHASYPGSGGGGGATANADTESKEQFEPAIPTAQAESRRIEMMRYQNTSEGLGPLFPEPMIQSVFAKLTALLQSTEDKSR